MNDTGGGVTAIHDVPGDITRIGFHWMLFFPFCHSKGGLLFVLHTECLGGHGVSLSRICEFSNCFFTRSVAEITDFFIPIFSLSRIIELSNIFHTECRGGHGFFLITRLVLGPTDQREVIFELFLHTECRGWLWGLLFMRMGGLFVVVYRPIRGVCV